MSRALALLASLAAILLLPSAALSVGQVWWASSTIDNDLANDAVSRVGTNGVGAIKVLQSPVTGNEGWPMGVALDVVGGRVFWLDYMNARIYRAGLDGSGTTTVTDTDAQPYVMSYDPVGDRLYWVTFNDLIQSVRTDGTDPKMLYVNPADSGNMTALAIAPASGRLYWGNGLSDTNIIGVAKMDGSGVLPSITPANCPAVSQTSSLAVDEEIGVLYRSGQLVSNNNFAIHRYTLATGACEQIFERGGAIRGLALDPDNNRLLYGGLNDENLGWINLDNTVQGGNLTTAGAPSGSLAGPAVAEAPRAAGALPAPTGTTAFTGSVLTCGAATWEGSRPGMNLFRGVASEAIRWERDGAPVAGATGASMTAGEPGGYRCIRSATNAIGTTEVASEAVIITAAPLAPVTPNPGTTTPGEGASETPSPGTAPGTAPAAPRAQLVGRLQIRKRTGGVEVRARLRLSPEGTWRLSARRGSTILTLGTGSRIAGSRLARSARSASLAATTAPVSVTLRLRGPARGVTLWLTPPDGSAAIRAR